LLEITSEKRRLPTAKEKRRERQEKRFKKRFEKMSTPVKQKTQEELFSDLIAEQGNSLSRKINAKLDTYNDMLSAYNTLQASTVRLVEIKNNAIARLIQEKQELEDKNAKLEIKLGETEEKPGEVPEVPDSG